MKNFTIHIATVIILMGCNGEADQRYSPSNIIVENDALQRCLDVSAANYKSKDTIISLNCDLTEMEFIALDLRELTNLQKISVQSDTIEELFVPPSLLDLSIKAPISKFTPDEYSSLQKITMHSTADTYKSWGHGDIDLSAINPIHISLRNYNLSRVLDLSSFNNLYSVVIDDCIIYNGIYAPDSLKALTLKNTLNNITLSSSSLESLTLNNTYSYFCNLESLSLASLTHLTITQCENDSVDLTKLPTLMHVSISNSSLTTIDLANIPNVVDLTLRNNKLGRLDLTPLEGTIRNTFDATGNGYDEVYRNELRISAEGIFSTVEL